MSTKLYNGIKFNSNRLGTVIRQLHSLKEDARRNLADTFRPKGRNYISLFMMYDKAIKEGMASDDRLMFTRMVADDASVRLSTFDVWFRVVVFERKGTLYGVYHDQTQMNYGMLFERDIATDFHYQDQSDRPGGVTPREWGFRRKVWEDIFGGLSDCWGPSEAGAVYVITGPDDICLTKDMMDSLKLMRDKLKKEGRI